MDLDERIQKAIAIGESNKEIIELSRNWCGHLIVEECGGTGMVEVETGLPIGMRSFKCPHAQAVGFAGMDPQFVALDFYDRNCVGCDKRLPVRFPNTSTTPVAERDSDRLRAEEAKRNAAAAEARALHLRTARRAELSGNTDPPTAGIFSALDQFDRQPDEQNRRVVLETAAAVPSRFNSQVQDVLFELADAGGFIRTETALEVLCSLGAEKGRLCESALCALARHDGHVVAGSIVATGLNEAHRSLVPSALPSLLSLGSPGGGIPCHGGLAGPSQTVTIGHVGGNNDQDRRKPLMSRFHWVQNGQGFHRTHFTSRRKSMRRGLSNRNEQAPMPSGGKPA